MDTWRDSGQVFKMTKSVKNEGGAENISHFLLVQPWERNRGKNEESKTSFDDPRSSVGRSSSGQELKYITSTRVMRVYQK